MEILGLILAVIGAIITLVGAVWIMVIAFQENVGWGIGTLLCGFITLYYGISRMPETKVPLFLVIGGVVLQVIGRFLGGDLGV